MPKLQEWVERSVDEHLELLVPEAARNDFNRQILRRLLLTHRVDTMDGPCLFRPRNEAPESDG